MKRIICILICFSVLFSFAACNFQTAKPTDGNTTQAPSTTDPYRQNIVRDKKLSQEFKAADGTVAYTVEATLPEIFGGCSQHIAAAINNHYSEIYKEALKFAEINVENAAKHMKNLNSEKPWTRKISYEVKFCSEKFLCLLIMDSMPLSADPTVTASCLNLNEGTGYTLSSFYTDGTDSLSESTTEYIYKMFGYMAESDLGPINDEHKAAIKNAFEENNFYFDNNSIYFIMQKRKIDPSLTGIYTVEFLWSDFEGELVSPFI